MARCLAQGLGSYDWVTKLLAMQTTDSLRGKDEDGVVCSECAAFQHTALSVLEREVCWT